MATSHAISVVKNHCYTAPRISKTDQPATAREISQVQHKHDFGKNGDEMREGNEFLANGTTQESTVGRHSRPKCLDTSLGYKKGDAVSEEQFYQDLLRLKEEHKKTLSLLKTKYYNELRKQNSFQWEGFAHGVGLGQQNQNDSDVDSMDGFYDPRESLTQYWSQRYGDQVIMHKPSKSAAVQDVVKDMSHSTIASAEDDSSDGEGSAENRHDVNQEKDPSSPEEFSSSLYPKRSAAIDMVEHLWKDFSVRDFTTREDETMEETELQKPKEKEWSPAITVPKPFTMTLREATKEKRKTRSMKMIEDELVLKKSMEEAELKKKFRAQPIPATTFLPLYDEIIENNNRRSKHVREISKAILKATEKPFSFIKREEIKKLRKEEEQKMTGKQKVKEGKKHVSFKARPPPKHMDDLTLADRLTEQDEYRKIRKKLRSADLLAKSRLPPSMEARANVSPAAKSRQKCRRNRGNVEKTKFRPNINPDVPDFEALHWEFEKELRRKKKERQPTVVEPFNLRTAHVPHGKVGLRRTRSMENLSRSVESPSSLRRNRPFSARLSSSQDALPFGMTESVRRRDNAVRKSLELRKERDKEVVREMKEKRKREKQLRSQVSVKAMANDHSWQLKKTSEQKLKTFRETDRGRQEEYERELAEMQRRVAQRPLLLEQEAQANAKRKAEKKYTQILRDAGVDEQLVNRLVTKNGNIADADDDSDDDVKLRDDEDNEDFSDSREYEYHSTHESAGTAGNGYLSEEVDEDNDSEVESAVEEY